MIKDDGEGTIFISNERNPLIEKMKRQEALIRESIEAWKNYHPYHNKAPKDIARMHYAMNNLEREIKND